MCDPRDAQLLGWCLGGLPRILALSTELRFLRSFSWWHSLSHADLAPTEGAGGVLQQMPRGGWSKGHGNTVSALSEPADSLEGPDKDVEQIWAV